MMVSFGCVLGHAHTLIYKSLLMLQHLILGGCQSGLGPPSLKAYILVFLITVTASYAACNILHEHATQWLEMETRKKKRVELKACKHQIFWCGLTCIPKVNALTPTFLRS